MARKKKNCSVRRAQRFTDALFRTNHVIVVGADALNRQCILMNAKTKAAIKCGPLLADSLARNTYQWTVYLAAFGKTQTGECYMKGEEWPLPGRYFQRDLAEGLNEVHRDNVIAKVPPHHYMGGGWIGSPVGESVSEDTAYDIFKQLGCWEGE